MPIYETAYYPFHPFSHAAIRVTAEILAETEKTVKLGVSVYFEDRVQHGILNGTRKGQWEAYKSEILQSWAEKEYYKRKYASL